MTSNEPTVGCLSAEVLTRSDVINIAQLYVILSLDNVVICVHPDPHRRASCERLKRNGVKLSLAQSEEIGLPTALQDTQYKKPAEYKH